MLIVAQDFQLICLTMLHCIDKTLEDLQSLSLQRHGGQIGGAIRINGTNGWKLQSDFLKMIVSTVDKHRSTHGYPEDQPKTTSKDSQSSSDQQQQQSEPAEDQPKTISSTS